jgi:hypothetical protein
LASPGDATVEEGDSTILEEGKRPCAAAAEMDLREQAGRPAGRRIVYVGRDDDHAAGGDVQRQRKRGRQRLHHADDIWYSLIRDAH